jgi:hypothetical protein
MKPDGSHRHRRHQDEIWARIVARKGEVKRRDLSEKVPFPLLKKWDNILLKSIKHEEIEPSLHVFDHCRQWEILIAAIRYPYRLHCPQ